MTDNNIQLTKPERETIVNFNDEDKTAVIYTCNKALHNKLKKLGYKVVNENEYSITFECDKKLISFRSNKTPKRILTEEQKEKMKKARENK